MLTKEGKKEDKKVSGWWYVILAVFLGLLMACVLTYSQMLYKYTLTAEQGSVCGPRTEVRLLINSNSQKQSESLWLPGKGCEILPVQDCFGMNRSDTYCVPVVTQTTQQAADVEDLIKKAKASGINP